MQKGSLIKGVLSLCMVLGCSVGFAQTALSGSSVFVPSVAKRTLERFWAIEANTLPADKSVKKSLSSFKGKPLLVNFWATWCMPCVREMPLLDGFAKQHPQLAVVGLALDSLNNMQKFETKVNVDYPLLQLGISYLKVVKQLGNARGGLPFTVLFDENGEMKAAHLGELYPEHLEALLNLL